MTTLFELIPNVDVLLALQAEELAGEILKAVGSPTSGDRVHLGTLIGVTRPQGHGRNGYPRERHSEVAIAITEGWQWLVGQGLLIPDPSQDGNSGWHCLSRRGKALVRDGNFATYARSASFPKSLLHPRIADEVWLDIIRGDLETAAFKAFRAVEVAVRDAGGFADTDIGTPLMRRAFDANTGPLTDTSQPLAEREALAHLFAGAIGSYKNPHSHRTVTIQDMLEAEEMVVLASHLLRIVDNRLARQASATAP